MYLTFALRTSNVYLLYSLTCTSSFKFGSFSIYCRLKIYVLISKEKISERLALFGLIIVPILFCGPLRTRSVLSERGLRSLSRLAFNFELQVSNPSERQVEFAVTVRTGRQTRKEAATYLPDARPQLLSE